MSSFADVAYRTQAVGLPLATMQALMQGVILPKNVLDELGLRVSADATTAVNPITRTIRFAFGPSGTTDATVTIGNDNKIEAVVVGNRGNDYVRPPFVSLTPALPTQAQLRAFLRVLNFTVVSGGAGYVTAPTITFMGGLPSADRLFRGCVKTIYMKDPGLGYPANTTCTIDSGGPGGPGVPATIQATAVPTIDIYGRITAVTLTNMGSGYTQVPKVAFHTHGTPPRKVARAFVSMAEGTPALGTATIGAGLVTGITLTNPGSGYVGVPDIIIGGPGTGASVTARMELERVDVLFPGAGYIAGTAVVFAPYFKTMFPDGTGQGGPFDKLFYTQFVNDVITPIVSATPVLIP